MSDCSRTADGRAGESPPNDDPRPVPPQRPRPDECCGNACDPCIFDLYDAALDRYDDALAAWMRRHARASP